MPKNQQQPPEGRRLLGNDDLSGNADLIVRRQTAVGPAGSMSKSPYDEDIIDLRHWWRMVMRYKWSLVSLTMVGFLVALFLSFARTPMYQASTTLQVDKRAASVVRFAREGDGMPELDDSSGMTTQLELLRSRILAERVIEKLNLDRAGKRDHDMGSQMSDQSTREISKDTEVSSNAETRIARPVQNFWSSWKDRLGRNWRKLRQPSMSDRGKLNSEQMIGAFRGAVRAAQVADSRMIRISVDNPDPELAAVIANATADSFISLNLERRLDASSYAKEFLNEQIELTKGKLEESERVLNNYAREHNILTLSEDANPLNVVYGEYSSALVKAREDRIKWEADYQAIQQAPNSSTEVLSNAAILNYKAQRSALDAEYQRNSKIYKDNYPIMLQLRAQIQDLDGRIQAEIGRIVGSIRSQTVAARQREEKIQTQLDKAREEIRESRDREVEYNLLKREVDTNRELYDGLLAQFKEVGVAGGVETNNIQIVDRAQAPLFPYKPRLAMNAMAGLLGGLVLGIFLMLLRESLDDSIKSIEEFEKNFHLPLLGAIPKIKHFGVQQSLAFLTYKDPRGHLAEAYRSLRTALQFSGQGDEPMCIAVTSTTNQEGKSTTALALAINFAQLGGKVALIDADMRHPMVHQYFGFDNSTGLSNYLSGQDAKGTSIKSKSADVGNLTVITAGPVPNNPVELLSGPRFGELLDRLSESGYKHIIIDGPPVLGLADAVVLGSKAKLLYVAQTHATRISHIKAALQRLRMSGVIPVGVVLTKTTEESTSYYSDESYYGYGALPMAVEPGVGSSVLPSV